MIVIKVICPHLFLLYRVFIRIKIVLSMVSIHKKCPVNVSVCCYRAPARPSRLYCSLLSISQFFDRFLCVATLFLIISEKVSDKTLIGSVQVTCTFLNQSLWLRELNVLIRQIKGTCLFSKWEAGISMKENQCAVTKKNGKWTMGMQNQPKAVKEPWGRCEEKS